MHQRLNHWEYVNYKESDFGFMMNLSFLSAKNVMEMCKKKHIMKFKNQYEHLIVGEKKIRGIYSVLNYGNGNN